MFILIARRLLLSIFVVAVVSYVAFVFFATKFGTPATGSSVALASGPSAATELWWRSIVRLAHGNTSTVEGGSEVGPQTWHSLGHTAALLGLAAVVVVVFALMIGVVSAAFPGSAADLVLRGFAYCSWAIPAFLVALVLQSTLQWLNSQHGIHLFATEGWPGQCLVENVFLPNCTPRSPTGLHRVGAFFQHLTVPAFALGLAFVGVHARYLRTSMLAELRAPYTTTARAKGLSERRLLFRHVLRNALPAFLTAMLLDFGALFGASLAVDYVFRLDGLGSLFVAEIATLVNPYGVELLLIVTSAFVLATSLIADVVTAALDPRGPA